MNFWQYLSEHPVWVLIYMVVGGILMEDLLKFVLRILGK